MMHAEFILNEDNTVTLIRGGRVFTRNGTVSCRDTLEFSGGTEFRVDTIADKIDYRKGAIINSTKTKVI